MLVVRWRSRSRGILVSEALGGARSQAWGSIDAIVNSLLSRHRRDPRGQRRLCSASAGARIGAWDMVDSPLHRLVRGAEHDRGRRPDRPVEPARPFGVLYGTDSMLVLGYLARFVPVAALIGGSDADVPVSHEEAPRDGAGWLRSVWCIVLPQIRLGLLAAWIITFILAFGELGASILVVPPGESTCRFGSTR